MLCACLLKTIWGQEGQTALKKTNKQAETWCEELGMNFSL